MSADITDASTTECTNEKAFSKSWFVCRAEKTESFLRFRRPTPRGPADEEIGLHGAKHGVGNLTFLKINAPEYGLIAESSRLIPA